MAHRAHAEIKGEAVDYKDGDTALQGYLAYDDALPGPRPGILVAHEWWGHDGYARQRAEMLAKLGYVAFALDMYGKGVVAKDPQEAMKLAGPFRADQALMRTRARAGLEVLLAHARVDKKHAAAIGYCFGGTVCLELARAGAPLAGVVSFHGGLETKNPDDARNIKGKVLVCTGGDDSAVPPAQVATFEDEMRKGGVDWQVIVYGGAKHAFTNPQADSHNLANVAYNEKADKRSWQAMQDFLNEIFK